MEVAVLGSAAGGGFPQWNSNAAACRRARAGDPAATPRTQAGIAVSADGERWVLIGASPDLPEQIRRSPFLWPRGNAARSSPIAAVVLTGADVDAVAGLLTLRERQPFDLLATGKVLAVLDGNPIFEVLARDVVDRRAVALDSAINVSGLTVELFAVRGKGPLYLEGRDGVAHVADESTVGARIRDERSSVFYIPSCAAMTGDLAERLTGADLVFFDGTLWRDDEMIAAGLGSKSGARMGHMSLSGPDGVLAAFEGIDIPRKLLIHLNNSNPVLLADSPERAEVEARGWEVAYDGLRLCLPS
ncbi:MAG: pyrroloquinoline quinone biosynthesis protein PqqB [Caulobacteraceae bacterium]